MFKSLFAKFTVVLMLLFLLLGALVAVLTLFSSEMYQQEVNQKLNREVAQHIVKETKLIKDGHINQAALQNLFHSLMVFNPSLEIYLLDKDGWIISYSAPHWKVVRQSVDLAPIKAYLAGQGGSLIKGDDPRNFDNSKVFSVAPIQNADKFTGYLYVILGGEEYDDIVQLVQNSHILKLSMLTIGIGVLFSIVTGIALFSGLTRRLKKLAIGMHHFKQMAKVDKNLLFRENGDEIDQLTATFLAMSEQINKQVEKLKTTDNLRRELVANVSHDLRTPLATLQGYIETLLIKDDALSREERGEYLQVAIKHCQRLNKLVSELFELAKLDAKETKPQQENFNLAELVQDIVQKFQVISVEKQIKIMTDADKISVFVYADISLIERVLQNLIDNALKHTPRGGTVNIVLHPENTGISVSVSDNGCGISEQDLPYIFDRFYQLDKNRTLQEGSSGLGLAIVKRIIELHRSVINVSSVPNNNTTFTFSLPLSSI